MDNILIRMMNQEISPNHSNINFTNFVTLFLYIPLLVYFLASSVGALHQNQTIITIRRCVDYGKVNCRLNFSY